MPVIQADALRQNIVAMFLAVGADDATAALVASSLVKTNLTGHDSHGVVRVPQYIELIQAGGTNPRGKPSLLSETAVLAQVDGDWALGQVAADFAIRLAIDKAKQQGLAAVGIVNCNHVGRLGEWVEMAANENLIGLGYCNGGRAGGFVTPYNGAGRCMGTNPLAAAFPLPDRPPMLVDFATSVVAEGKIRVARNAGKQLPTGLFLDKHGHPSTQPDELYDGGMLLTAAGHKGYGLSLMIEFLAGVVTGRGCSSFDDFETGNGVLFIVLQADAFRPLDEYMADAARMVGYALGVPAAPDSPDVLLPGDPERIATAARVANGIPIDDGTWQHLVSTAAALGTTWQESRG